jgi:hypothetical protein
MSPWEFFITKADSLDALFGVLERFLSSCDYVEEKNGKKYVVENRVRVDAIGGYKIEIYGDEHSPPHFHIVKDSKKIAAYSIEDCTKLNGNLPNGAEKKVKFFHDCAKDKLIRFWNDTRPSDCVVGKIHLT